MLVMHYKLIMSAGYFCIIKKKDMALTIPYSGKAERPRWSNYSFISGFVGPKTHVKV